MAVLTRLFALFLSFFTVGNLRPVQQPLNAARPEGWLAQGSFHRVFFDASDTSELQWLRERGAVLKEVDYGMRVMAMIDESFVGGRFALLAQGWNIRDDQNRVLFDGLPLDTTRADETLGKLDRALRIGISGAPAMDPDAGLYIVQFIGPVKDEWLTEVEAAGADCFQAVPWNAYVARIAPENTATLESLAREREEIQYVGVYEPVFRMAPRLRKAWIDEAGSAMDVTVQLVEGPGVRAELEALQREASAWLGYVRVGPYLNASLTIDPAALPTIAARGTVFGIEERGVRRRLDEAQDQIVAGNLAGNSPSGPGYLAWLAGKGFTSAQFNSFSVNVVDDATSLTGHPDVPSGRVEFTLNPSSQSGLQGGHGFLNAHIVGGFNNGTGSTVEDGSGFNYGLGVAPWAHVGSTAIFGPGGSNPSSYESSAYGFGARISTNSWGFQTSGGAPIPDYDSNSQQYDFLTRDVQSGTGGNQEYLVLFAAGNDGSGSNTLSTPGTAKNIITVGASENVRQTGTDGCGVPNSGANSANDMASFSSRGPVNSAGGDGRWKPEIVAPGTHVQAGVPQSNFDGGSSVCNGSWPPGSSLYGWSSGTSHSTPALAGGAALVYQWFLNQSQPLPSPALAKAILVNTADYMNGTGANDTLPSNSQGMGRMYLERAFDTVPKIFVDQSQLLTSTGTSFAVGGDVADIAQPFRVSLVWTDAPGPTTGAPYVNDLNLTVNVGGSTYLGNVFLGANSATGGSADFKNNTESVFIPAGVSGAFTVTVNGASIGGDGVPGNGDSTDQDFALYIYNGTQGTGPNAQFGGSPTSGISPLAVSFSDFSTGIITSWSWTFGDGGTSTLQDPAHTYTAIGIYDVSLTVNGPDGPDTNTKLAYIDAQAPPPPGISDNSFEAQTAASAPTTPWSVFFGSGHVVNPAGTASDNGFASHGSKWAEVAADSTNGATPPSNPGGVTTPAVGGAGISQDFTYPAGQAQLEFDASFLRNENANQATFNDWMSVDVSDGATTINVFHKDTFSPVGAASLKYGFAMTAIETATADLSVLFPASTTATLFTVTIQVGNGNDGLQPSKGYVDNFRFTTTASAPTANFSGAPTNGAVPLSVAFADLSTGTVTAWAWTFGDGGSSTLQNPSHSYTAVGTYTVSLTATGPLGSDPEMKAGYITVTPPAPVANFSGTPTSGIVPLAVAFTDLTSGAVTGWSWNFGDAGASTLQSPSHTYVAAGTYTVSLTATGPGGSHSEAKLDYITVNDPPPVAQFSGLPLSGVEPLTVAFTDLSSGPVTGWSWNFGDASSSSVQNPAHTYAGAGTYTVTLTATGPGGSDGETKLDYITVNNAPPVAEFSGTPTTLIGGGPVSFTDLSSGLISSHSWSFGDGGTSITQSPAHTYNAVGTYTVALTVAGPGGSSTETKVGYITVIEATVADFSGTPTSGVSPLAVAFSDLSTGSPSTWSWTFGDGGSASSQNPMHTYASAGTYTVSMNAGGPGGSDTATKAGYIVVSEPPPVANFAGTPTSGVEPLSVAFTDLSSGPITGWSWSFGDASSSSVQNPAHTYAGAGTYTVTLTATGPGGSDGETKLDYITVNNAPPVAEFSGTPTTLIGGGPVSFTDLSSGLISSHSWSFGDGGTSITQSPVHTYSAVGTYTVALTVTGPGGPATETKLGYVTVLEPTAAEFSAIPTNGVAPLSVNFTDLSTGSPSTWSWVFGDGASSSAQNPSHTYAASGTYTVSLTANGPGGSNLMTKTGYITVLDAVVADFSGTPTSGVAPLSVSFTDLTSAGSASSWSFGDGNSSSLQNPTHIYATSGMYTVSMTATGPGGSDTLTKTNYITVVGSTVADFNATPTTGIVPLAVAFTDATMPAASSWSWTFGDGGVSSAQNPSHTYAAVGTYTVSLTATGPGGIDSEIKANFITVDEPAPVAMFSGTPTTGTEPLSVSFTDLSSGPITSWAWNFGDMSTSALQNPTHTYASAGTYTVAQTVTGPGGVSTETKLDYINVGHAAPVADFIGSPTSGIGSLTVTFTDTSTGSITTTSWSFGDGGMSTLQNPTHVYGPGIYTVSRTVAGPGGMDTETKLDYITVLEATVANFSAIPTTGTAPLGVTFTDATTPSATSWSWDFGDTGSSTLQNPTHNYANAGTYTVSLTASGAGGADLETKIDYILVNPAATVTYRNGTGVNPACFSATAPVIGTTWTAGVDSTVLPGALVTIVFGRLNAIAPLNTIFGELLIDPGSFLFDSIRVSAGGIDTHTFVLPNDPALVGRMAETQAMVYVNGTTAQFCNGASLLVGYTPSFPLPAADFSVTPTSGVAPLSVNFSDLSSGSVTSWTWNFGDGNSSTVQNPAHTYTAPGNYTVSLVVEGLHGYDSEIKVGHVSVTSSIVADRNRTGTSSAPSGSAGETAPQPDSQELDAPDLNSADDAKVGAER